MSRAQSWSLEVIITMSVFIVVFIGALLIFVVSSSRVSFQEVQEESIGISRYITQNEEYAIVKEGKVDSEKFAELAQRDVAQLKRELGVSSDFCIFVESANGTILPVRVNGSNYTSIGSGNINISGTIPCGS